MCRRRWALHTRVDPRVSDYRAYDGMLPCILLACQRTASVIAKSMCTVRGNRIELVIERGASQRCRQAPERKVRSPKGFPRSNIEEFEISNGMGFFFLLASSRRVIVLLFSASPWFLKVFVIEIWVVYGCSTKVRSLE